MKQDDRLYVEKTKVYRKTFWMLTILGDVLSGLCEIIAIICLFLDKNTFVLKYYYFGIFLLTGFCIVLVCNIINSIMLRFVYRDDINYKNDSYQTNDDETNDDETNDDETNEDEIITTNEVIKYNNKNVDMFYKRPAFYLLVIIVIIVVVVIVCAATL